jgi:pimeloyl-ACP methyl ester carboxylesterase
MTNPSPIAVPQDDLDDLHARLTALRWPADVPGDGWDRGVPADHLRELVGHWRYGFDWRARERELNALGPVVVEIDGQPVHALHVRSAVPDALPLVLTHGWPSSVAEFTGLVGPLTDPAAHGGDPADAFHVVLPSLPGFALSTPLRERGWELTRTARAWVELMERLGYDRYGLHGGDIGSGVSGAVGALAPDRVVGVHASADTTSVALLVGMGQVPVDLDRLTPDERTHLGELRDAVAEEDGYLRIQATRPRTLGYGLSDSPALQLAWIAEKFHRWTEHPVDVDRLLTTVSLYWFTRTGPTAAQFIYEAAHSGQWLAPGGAPQGISVFDSDPLVRRLLDPDHGTGFWAEHAAGGHFPAMEVPDLLLDDLRAFFRPLR